MKTLTINTPSCQSTIYCGNGAFAERTAQLKGKNLFIVTDSNVYRLYKSHITGGFGDCPAYILPAGERSKNYNQLLKILSAMLKAGITRSSTVVALGGGVVGDIAGLAASLYMRGVNLVQIPTTLLAQVDSSVGGKTAVDFQGVKNIIGAFYQPSEVIVDPLFLRTLPRREIRCGLGEIIKYGALDKDIFKKLSENSENLFSLQFQEDITYDCIRHKAAVVCADERDTGGLRKTLNLGHTTGHAFELYYKRKSHGEFVLIGMYYEILIAQKMGVCGGEYAEKLKRLIKKVVTVPAYADAEKAATYAKYDKKNELNTLVTMIVPQSEGQTGQITLPAGEYCNLIALCRDGIKEKKL